MKSGFTLLNVSAAFALSGFFFCAPLSTETTDDEPTLLRLSLEETGRVTAEFSGAPIEAIVELDRDTVFDSLRWQTGKGDPPYHPKELFGNVAKRFSVQLFWTRYPLVKDTADNCFWDTVWVSMGGGLKTSNKVRVKVTNLPVVFDSVRFDTMLFYGQDTVWRCSLPAVLKNVYELHAYARDLDRTPVTLQVFGSGGRIVRADPSSQKMSYEPPPRDFTDTVIFVASDQMRGRANRMLVIRHVTPNILPFIDSVLIGREMLGPPSFAGGMYRVGFVAFDTLPMYVYAHDSSGSVRTVRWSSRGNAVGFDSTSPLRATYVCAASACGDTLRDSSVALDTIRVAVFDDRGDSTVKLIELSRGTINKAPVISALWIDGTELAPADTVVSATLTGGLSHLLRITASDPEKKAFAVSWSGFPAARFSGKTDSTIRYAAPAAGDTDTVRITVSDGKSAGRLTVRLIVGDIAPVLDSIVIGDTVFRSDDTAYALTVSPRDTLLLLAYVRDRDTDDSMRLEWSASKMARFTVRLGNRARYVLPADSLNDTIILNVQDGAYEATRAIHLRPVNRPPFVDSIRSNNVRLIQSGSFFQDSAFSGDTIDYRIYTRDPENDSLSFDWSSLDSTAFISRESGTATYVCGDTAYVDTVSVQVDDPTGNATLRRIILKVDTLATP